MFFRSGFLEAKLVTPNVSKKPNEKGYFIETLWKANPLRPNISKSKRERLSTKCFINGQSKNSQTSSFKKEKRKAAKFFTEFVVL